MTSSGHFDESDLKSFYYGGNLAYEDAREILFDQDEGVFLVRDSARGGLVICVKEQNEVMQYPVQTKGDSLFIREEYTFKDLSALLSFYKRNLFTSTALIRPVTMDRVLLHQLKHETVGERRTMISEMPQQSRLTDHPTRADFRMSAPPDVIHRTPCNKRSDTLCPPVYAKVIKARTPISYDTSALTLKVNDVIRVTKRKDGQGHGEHCSTGKSGTFPLTHVELIESLETAELPQ